MEDEKLSAYYDEQIRKGSGAARFKQGLGFSSSTDSDIPARCSASSPSFLSGFVKASTPSKTSEFEKQAQLQSIQKKLNKIPKGKIRGRSRSQERDNGNPARGIRSRDRSRDKHSRRGNRSRSDDRYRRRRSSCSRSPDRDSSHKGTSRDRSALRLSRVGNGSRSDRRLRSGSPEKGKRGYGVRNDGLTRVGVDYAKLIKGYDHMTRAERVKAKMKLQLSKTADNDESMGRGSGWERFDFNIDAPLDDEEEIEAAEDDAVLLKHIGQSFRFSAVEARKEEDIKAAHDEAMFGASSFPPPAETVDETEEEGIQREMVESAPVANLLSDQVLTLQQGSWRDRARKR